MQDVASRFYHLQKRVFPELKEIEYVPRNGHWKHQHFIAGTTSDRFLASSKAIGNCDPS